MYDTESSSYEMDIRDLETTLEAQVPEETL